MPQHDMKTLYRPDERLGVDDFLAHKFGTTACPPGHEDLWRLELTAQIIDSRLFALSNFFYVADKKGNLVLLRPFCAQAILEYVMRLQQSAGLPVQIGTVKARQLGSTTWFIGAGLHRSLEHNRRGLILVDDEDVAVEQATRLGTMLNGLPGWLQPMRRIQNIKHIQFDNPNPKDRMERPGLNSSLQITVPSSFRGVPPGFVLASEYAHMDPNRQIDVQTGIVSAMPMNEHSMLIYDTTPNGFDDSYYPMVMEAAEENPKWVRRIEQYKGELTAEMVLQGILGVPDNLENGNLIPAMAPWRFHEEYTCRSKGNNRGELPPLKKEQRAELLATLGTISKYGGEEEKDLVGRYDLTPERLFWRRRKIDRYKLPTEEMKLLAFRQEFYLTLESCFVDSGQTPFDRDCLDALMRQERAPAAVGLFRSEGEFDHHAQSQWQQIRLYAPPQNGERYTMGIDTNIAYESPDSDATVAQVVRFRDNKIVATYEARVPEYLLREQLYYLYRWYFNAYYAVETKGMGYQLVRTLMDMGMSNVHYWKRYDADSPEPSKYPGWETTEKTRPMMDQTFTEVACHRDSHTNKAAPEIIIPDKKTLQEIRGLTRTPTGAFKANRGHDDHYDALTIALCIANDPYSGLRRKAAEEEERKKAEFEASFNAMTRYRRHSNETDLCNL